MATIRLYTSNRNTNVKWHLLANKLLVIEDISSYLSNLGSSSVTTINNAQYIKHGLEISINLDLSQNYAQPSSVTDYKYVYIYNGSVSTERACYYFVKKANWRSKSCVNFELVMDVLNTFEEGKDYSFKASTKITREHKNRFSLQDYELNMIIEDLYDEVGTLAEGDTAYIKYEEDGETYNICSGKILSISASAFTIRLTPPYDPDQVITTINNHTGSLIVYKDASNYISFGGYVFEFDAKVFRNIDRTPENIVPLLVCDNTTDEKVENQKSKLRGDWYLLYRNQNDPDPDTLLNPVECYLIPENEKEISTGSITSAQITSATLEAGKIYFIPIYCRGITDAYIDFASYNQSLTLSNGISIGGHDYTDEVSYVAITKNQDNTLNIVFNKLVYDNNSGVARFALSQEIIYKNIPYITINQSPTYYGKSTSISLTTIEIFEDLLNTIDRESFTYTGTGLHINGINLLDRTDAKNIKLIKLPYCPYDFNVSGEKVDIAGTNWNYEDLEQADHSHIKVLKLNDLNTKLSSTIEETTYNPFDYLYFNKLSNLPITASHLREQANYESKLYHSEFFTPTFYYDSFAFKFELEKCDLFTIFANYTKTSVVNEIEFDMTKTINSKFMFTFKNYEVWNNDQNYSKYLPIARNNEEVLYNVPYINYIRTGYQYDVKNKNISNISNALGVGLSAGSLAVSLALPSAPLKVAGVVASLVSMAMSVKNAVVSAIQTDNSLKQKITQYQNQVANVSGSDDVDLMSIYAENRLKYLEYAPRLELQNLIFDLFFYAGYRSERMGIPTHNNRVNFDYLECEANLEFLAGGIPQECVDELIKCFQNGVTYIHKNTHRSAIARWDIEQKYENWETMFFD